MSRAKLNRSFVAEWRNWQTHQTQNLAKFTLRVGSTPTSATIVFATDSRKVHLSSGKIGQSVVEQSMALSLYRRHRRDCKSGHVEDSRSREFDERKKGWRRCDCPIFVSGTLARRFHRESTGHWEWSDAKAVLAHWEKNGSWDPRRVHIEPPSATDSNEPRSIMTVDATDAFIASCTNRAA